MAGAHSRCAAGHGAASSNATAPMTMPASTLPRALRASASTQAVSNNSAAIPTHTPVMTTRRAWPASTHSISAASRCANGHSACPATACVSPNAYSPSRNACCTTSIHSTITITRSASPYASTSANTCAAKRAGSVVGLSTFTSLKSRA
ncbi:hypothetical protein SDC9_204228 [bioreactor metagenome]|uniref:Uncharacterized protein n=1 Tax=bioreactor metagenome TaxID=1076179 RepID=A0A645IYP7_9ZZZZ